MLQFNVAIMYDCHLIVCYNLNNIYLHIIELAGGLLAYLINYIITSFQYHLSLIELYTYLPQSFQDRYLPKVAKKTGDVVTKYGTLTINDMNNYKTKP